MKPISIKTQLSVQSSAPPVPLKPIWRYLGYDEPNYTYTDLGRELLGKLAGMTGGPFSIRCHFLFCNGDGTPSLKWGSTNVYSEDASGAPRFHWEIIERIFDTYVELGLIPFVELGFTPRALSSAPAGTVYESSALGSGWSYPPNDMEKWSALVAAVVERCVARYGLREVTRWRWELWNEPDIPYFTGSVEEYCELYDHTEHAIHSIYPMLLVGGPSTTNPGSSKAGEYLRRFLDHCASGTNHVTGERGTRLDFITFHAKGAHLTREPNAPKQTPTVRTLVNHVRTGLDIVSGFPVYADREIVVSECDPDGWAAGTRYDNPNLEYRNNEYYASYVAAVMCELLDLVPERYPNASAASGAAEARGPGASSGAPSAAARIGSPAAVPPSPRVDGALTWAFEFEGREVFEGLRSLSTNGLDKAVLNTFRLLERLGPWRLPVEVTTVEPAGAGVTRSGVTGPGVPGEDGLTFRAVASRWEDGRLAVLVVSHHDDWDAHGSVSAELRVADLPAGGYRVQTVWVDSKAGNAYADWIAMGRPPHPGNDEMRHLADAARLRPQASEVTVGPDGAAVLGLDVEIRSVTLLSFVPAGV